MSKRAARLQAIANSVAAKYARKARIKARQDSHKPVDGHQVLGGQSHRCWCGEPNGHTWPGRDQGDPHPPAPRSTSPTPLGHRCLFNDIEVAFFAPDRSPIKTCIICGQKEPT